MILGFHNKYFVPPFQVICAFGRLGTMFGCDKYNIQPDLVSIAKVSSDRILARVLKMLYQKTN